MNSLTPDERHANELWSKRAMDNIPEFSEGGAVTPNDSAEHARHGAAMFATGVIEGLRQAIYAIETERSEVQPSGKWPGMNAAIAAVERAISKAQAANSEGK